LLSSGRKSSSRRSATLFLVYCFLALSTAISLAQASVSPSPVSSSDEASFEQATAALKGGDFSRAESILEELRLRHPHSYEIDESLGLAYASQGRLEAAVPLLKAAAEEQPTEAVGHANLGAAYLKLGRNANAAQELQTAARLDPGNAQTQEALGQAWMLLRQPRKATEAFSAALVVDGENSDLLYNGALAFFDSGDAAQAESLLSRMPGADASAQAQSLYGDVEEKLGRYKNAAQHYIDAARLAPSEANVYVLGVDFLRHWTFGPAIQEFQAGIKQFPGSRRMRLGLGVAYFGNVNYDRAAPIFADLLAGEPENGVYADLLGQTCAVLAAGQSARCAEVLAYAEKHPQNAMLSTYVATGILHGSLEGGQFEVARRLLQAAILAEPRLPEARYEMAVLLQRQEQWERSIPQLEAAVRSKPDYFQAHYRLAQAYSRLGRRDEASREVALEQKYSRQKNEGTDTRMRQITTLLVKMK
jgi:predicted Zn-dependent protease